MQFNVTIGLLSMVAMLGLNNAIVRFLPAEKKDERRDAILSIAFFIFVIGLMLSLLMLAASEILLQLIGNKEVILILALVVPVYCINLAFLDFFMAIGQMKRYSFFFLLQIYGDVLLISYFVQFGIMEVVSAVLFVRIGAFLLMFFYLIKEFGFAIPTFSRMREYLRYSLPLIPATVSAWIVSSSDRYLIAYFLGVSYAGLYSPGYSIGTVIFMFGTPVVAVLTPTISKLYEEDKSEEVKKYLSYSLKYFLLLAIPSVFGLTILSKQLLIILTTGEIANQGYLVVPFVALSALLYQIGGVYGQILMLTKKTRIMGITSILAAVTNFILNLIFIPSFGIVGAAITTLIAYSLIAVIIIFSSLKYFTFDTDWLFLLKSISASILMSIAILLVNPIQTLDVLVWVGIGAGMYVCVLFLLRGFPKEEIRFFRELFHI